MWLRSFVLLCLMHACCSFQAAGCSFIAPSSHVKLNGLKSCDAPASTGRCASSAQKPWRRLRMLWAEGDAGGEGGESAQPEKASRAALGSASSSSSVGSGLLDALRGSHQRQMGQSSSGAGLLEALQNERGDSNLLQQIMSTTKEDKRAVGELEQLLRVVNTLTSCPTDGGCPWTAEQDGMRQRMLHTYIHITIHAYIHADITCMHTYTYT